MIEVKRPELLTSSLAVSQMLHPSKGSLKLQMDDVSECTLTLEDKAETIPMHGWVKIYNQFGFVGYFRRTSRNHTVYTDNSYTLKHGIDILQDSVWDDETEFSGTVTQFLTALLNKQTHLINGVKPWALGTVADTSSVKKDINYDNLLDLLQSLANEKHEYYFTFNQTVWPWTVSFVAKPSSVASEFRLNRNIEKCSISDNDSELCTRLILNVNEMVDDTDLATETGITVKQNSSVIRTYNNTSAQASYGIIVKTADIDVTGDTFPNGPFPEADAWANDFLAKRAAPLLQIEIDGRVLKGITGSDWDESKIGTKVRAALPEYSQAVEERCVTVTYQDLYGAPDSITVSLANSLPTYTKSVSSTQQTVSNLSKGARGGSRQAESFEQHFEITDKAGNVLRQAGMHLDANGLLVYANDNVNMVGAKFEVQAQRIGMVVGHNSSGNYIKAAEIAVAINDAGEGVALINADHVNISATSTAHTLAGELEYDAQGRLVIKNAGGLYVKKTTQGVTSYFGVWREDTLTAGVIATIVNGESSTLIKGTKIQIGTDETVGTWISGKTYLDDVTASYIDGKISTLATLHARDISCNNITAGVNIYGPNGLSLYTNGVWTLTLTDNHNDTYTLSGTKLNGDSFTVGTFSRGGGEADRIAGWNDYEGTSWYVPTDSGSGGKFKIPSEKDANGDWEYVEWTRGYNSVVWDNTTAAGSSSDPGGTLLGGVNNSNNYVSFTIHANGASKKYKVRIYQS